MEKCPGVLRIWSLRVAGTSNSRYPVAAGHACHGFSVAATGGPASTVSPFFRKLGPGVWLIQQENAESRIRDGRLSFPGISGKYLGRAV